MFDGCAEMAPLLTSYCTQDNATPTRTWNLIWADNRAGPGGMSVRELSGSPIQLLLKSRVGSWPTPTSTLSVNELELWKDRPADLKLGDLHDLGYKISRRSPSENPGLIAQPKPEA